MCARFFVCIAFCKCTLSKFNLCGSNLRAIHFSVCVTLVAHTFLIYGGKIMDFLSKLFKNNMFTGNREKHIPKTFKDCYKTDSMSNDLWHWCENLERWGKILFILIIVGGLILAITGSITEKEVVIREATSWRDAETEIKKSFDINAFIYVALETTFYAIIEYIMYHIIALLIGALATIVQSTRITANVALYKFATKNGISTNNTESTNCAAPSADSSNDKLSKIILGNSTSENNKVKKFCPHCGSFIKSNTCEICGKENNLF